MADVTQGSPSKKPASQPAPGGPKPAGQATPADALNVRDPDAIQEGMINVWHVIENNSHIVVGLLLAIVIGTAGYGVRNWWVERSEKNAQDAYYAIEAKYTKAKEGFDRAKAKDPAAKDDKTPATPATGDLAKDYGTIPEEFEKVAREHSSRSAGAQAAIMAADLYMTHGQPDKAALIAEVPAKALAAKTLMGSLVTITWGNALAAKGDCAEAVKAWKTVLDQPTAAFLHADAALRSGLCYETLNQPDKAREMYSSASTQGEESAAGATAKSLLRALEAKSKSALLAPAKG